MKSKPSGRDDIVEGSYLHAVRRGIANDMPYLTILGIYTILGLSLHRTLGYPAAVSVPLAWGAMWRMAAFYMFLAVGVLGLARVLRALRPGDRPAGGVRVSLKRLFPPSRIPGFVAFVLIFPLWLYVFVMFKASIPLVHPFSLDPLFMNLDRALHFGRDPWTLLHPLLGQPATTKSLDTLYYLWFFVMWMTLFWQIIHGRPGVREQFLLSFVLCWILLGTIAATLLSSAGPVYFGEVAGDPTRFRPLIDYLERVDADTPLVALAIKDGLWGAYIGRPTGMAGISAMPSLHVSIAMLMVLLGFATRPAAGIAYTVYAVLIFLGSIQLAWHYAIDGYVSMALTWVIWRVSGRVSSWWARYTLNARSDSGVRIPSA